MSRLSEIDTEEGKGGNRFHFSEGWKTALCCRSGSRSGSGGGGVIMYAPANSSIKTSCQRCQEYFFPLFIKTLDVSGSVNPSRFGGGGRG